MSHLSKNGQEKLRYVESLRRGVRYKDETRPNTTSIKSYIDSNYRYLMMLAMGIELVFLAVLVVLELILIRKLS